MPPLAGTGHGWGHGHGAPVARLSQNLTTRVARIVAVTLSLPAFSSSERASKEVRAKLRPQHQMQHAKHGNTRCSQRLVTKVLHLHPLTQ